MGEMRLHGRGGQGTVMAAQMMAAAFVLGGKYASVFPSFGIERRGSAVMAFARFGDKPIREKTRVYNPDILLFIDESLTDVESCYDGFQPGGIIVANTKNGKNIEKLNVNQSIIATVDAESIALQETGTPITNTCMLGAFAKATGLITLENLKKALEDFFKGKVLAGNIRSLERGYNEVKILKFNPKYNEKVQEKNILDEKDPVIDPPKFVSEFEADWTDVSKKQIIAKTGEWRYRHPEVDIISCKLCGWCDMFCPLNCMKLGDDGYYHANLKYCKGCGICANECPAHAIKMKPEEVI